VGSICIAYVPGRCEWITPHMLKKLHNNITRMQNYVIRIMDVDNTGISCGSIWSPSNKPSFTRCDPVWTGPTILKDFYGLEIQHPQKRWRREFGYPPEVNELKGCSYIHDVIPENSWTTLEQPWSYFVSNGQGTSTAIMVVSSEALSSFRNDEESLQRSSFTLPECAEFDPLCRSISGYGLARVTIRSGKSIERSIFLMDARSSRSWQSTVPLGGCGIVLVCPIMGSVLSFDNLSLRLFRPSVKKKLHAGNWSVFRSRGLFSTAELSDK
jgi:hypothetical protein